MNEKQIVREAMKVRGLTQAMLADAAGMKNQSNVSEILRGQTLKTQTLVRLLDAMGFDLIIKDRNGSNRENVWKVEYER
jgi:transcriptional regulator with XRE-family HTH domain